MQNEEIERMKEEGWNVIEEVASDWIAKLEELRNNYEIQAWGNFEYARSSYASQKEFVPLQSHRGAVSTIRFRKATRREGWKHVNY